jgi:hypothetical protein
VLDLPAQPFRIGEDPFADMPRREALPEPEEVEEVFEVGDDDEEEIGEEDAAEGVRDFPQRDRKAAASLDFVQREGTKPNAAENRERLRILWQRAGLDNQHQLTGADFTVEGTLMKGPARRIFDRARFGGGGGGEGGAFVRLMNEIDAERGKGHMVGYGHPGGSMNGAGKRPRPTQPWQVKGSQEAKQHMADLRAKRMRK